MAAQTLTLAGKKFVLLPKREYDRLRDRASSNGTASRPHRMTKQDWGDVAEAKRRLADPDEKPVPYAEARKRLGLA